METVTGFAKAQREIALAKGEPLVQNGYPPSVFEMIPNLIFRTGTNDKGTITAFYLELHDSDGDIANPIVDKMNACLDGHIVLSRKLAYAGHFPTIDILASKNRISKMVTGKRTQKAVYLVSKLIKDYELVDSLIRAGKYQKGISPEFDLAIEKHCEIEQFLQQEEDENCSMADTLNKLSKITGIDIPREEYAESPDV
jgi:flagellum-specific ATP synthase